MSPVTTVVAAAPAAPAAPATPAAPGTPAAPTAAELAAARAETAAAKATAEENARAAQYWQEKAKGAAPAPKKDEPAEPDEDLLDLITTKGAKGLDELLKKRGFVRADDVEKTVNTKATQLSKESELLGRYPHLKDQDSDFFKTTAGHYGELKRSGVPESLAMELAAERTELQGIKSGKIKTAQQVTDDAKAARTAERAARAAAGGGDHSTRQANEEDDDTPTPDEQRAIARLADALEISVEKAAERYKARAKKGVNVALKIGGK